MVLYKLFHTQEGGGLEIHFQCQFLQFSTYISNTNQPLSVAISCHQIGFCDIKNAGSGRQVEIYRR